MTQRLLALADQNWVSMDGQAAGSLSTDLLDLPFDRFLNYVYWWMTREGEPDGIRKFDTHLWMPPKGEAPAPSSPWSPENETAAFKSLSAALKPSGAGKSLQSGDSPASEG